MLSEYGNDVRYWLYFLPTTVIYALAKLSQNISRIQWEHITKTLCQGMWTEVSDTPHFGLTVSVSNIPELVLFPIQMERKSALLMLLMTKSTMCEMFKFHLWLEHPV